jgi:hypothetical protein
MKAFEEPNSGPSLWMIVQTSVVVTLWIVSVNWRLKLVYLVEELWEKGRFFKNVRLDDSRENAPVERAFKVKFEFSGSKTSQRKDEVKRKFQR